MYKICVWIYDKQTRHDVTCLVTIHINLASRGGEVWNLLKSKYKSIKCNFHMYINNIFQVGPSSLYPINVNAHYPPDKILYFHNIYRKSTAIWLDIDGGTSISKVYDIAAAINKYLLMPILYTCKLNFVQRRRITSNN